MDGEDDHVVRAGETLNAIAARLLHEGETRRVQRALAQHNRLQDADVIFPGQILRIPRAWLKSRPGTLEVAAVRATDADGSVGPYNPTRVLEVPAKTPKPACLIEGPAGGGARCSRHRPRRRAEAHRWPRWPQWSTKSQRPATRRRNASGLRNR